MIRSRFFAAILAFLLCTAALCSCSSTKNQNVVVIRAGETTITKLYFSDTYSNNSHSADFESGSIDGEEYFNLIVSELTELAVTAEAARRNGLTLSDEERRLIDANASWYFDSLLFSYYPTPGPEPIGGDEKRRHALNALNEHLSKSGYTSDDYVDYYSKRHEYKLLSEKFYDFVTDNITLNAAAIEAFIASRAQEQASMSMADFDDAYAGFVKGVANLPLYSPEDCFSVNYIFVEHSDELQQPGKVAYNPTASASSEDILDLILSEGVSKARFNELIGEFGSGADMNSEAGIEWGVIIHPDTLKKYPSEFGYAAMNLSQPDWTPDAAQNDGTLPELSFFTLTNGEKVVKVSSEAGVYYITANRSFKKGPLEYEYGGDVWNAAYDAAYDVECEAAFDRAYEEALKQTELEIFYDRFKSEYVD